MCQCNLTPCGGGTSLTTSICAGLNTARILRGLDRPLELIVHDPAEPGDYLSIGTVTNCFLIKTTGEGVMLDVLETTDNTPALLEQMTGCVFDSKVYKISGTDKIRQLGTPSLWTFALRPTGEPFA